MPLRGPHIVVCATNIAHWKIIAYRKDGVHPIVTTRSSFQVRRPIFLARKSILEGRRACMGIAPYGFGVFPDHLAQVAPSPEMRHIGG